MITRHSVPILGGGNTGLSRSGVAYSLEHTRNCWRRGRNHAASALSSKASLRANPKVDASVSKTITGTDNNYCQRDLPLELGGPSTCPDQVVNATRNATARRWQSRTNLAADVRTKFGEASCRNSQLGFDEDLIAKVSADITWCGAGHEGGTGSARTEQGVGRTQIVCVHARNG